MTLCACGCGSQTTVAKKSAPRLGIKKGQWNKHIRGHKSAKPRGPKFTRCEAEDGNCGRPNLAGGLCSVHYQRKKSKVMIDGPLRNKPREPIIDGKRICTRCEEDRPLDDYRTGKDYKDGRFPYCTDCEAAIYVAKRLGDMSLAGKIRQLYTEQEHTCAICHEVEKNGSRLAVDHNHDTGEIRGLLCSKCNTGLGLFRERPELFFAAVKYLESYAP